MARDGAGAGTTTPVNPAIVWGLLAIAVVANVAGYVADLYGRLWWFDEALHGFTLGALTLGLGLLLYYAALLLPGDRRLWRLIVLALVIAAVGVAIGALWEIGEWAYDQVVTGNAIKGKRDTIIDLIMDTIGALVAGCWIAIAVGNSEPQPPQA